MNYERSFHESKDVELLEEESKRNKGQKPRSSI
jgi:hypothetical protein